MWVLLMARLATWPVNRNRLSQGRSRRRRDPRLRAEDAQDAHRWFADIWGPPGDGTGRDEQAREHRVRVLAAGRRCSLTTELVPISGISIFRNLMCFGDLFMTGVVKNWKRLAG